MSDTATRRGRLGERVRAITIDLSGTDVPPAATATAFVDLGFDSLFLTQLATRLSKEFKVKVKLRQLTEDLASIDAIARHLDAGLPPDPDPAPRPAAALAPAATPVATRPATEVVRMAPEASVGPPRMAGAPSDTQTLEHVFSKQLEIMGQQLAMLTGQRLAESAQVPPTPPEASVPASTTFLAAEPAVIVEPLPAAPAPPAVKPFGAQARIERAAAELSPRQQKYVAQFIQRYTQRTASSKAYTQTHRARLADPRTVSGFNPRVKEMVYSIVAQRSEGARVWDLDGNEYIDLLCGYGSCYFGHAAPFVVEALQAQLARGFEIGPQHHLAGEVAELFCDLVGHDRAAFCNTGSEAVLGAVRIARTVTGRSRIVTFGGAYHGINDEVIVRGTFSGRSIPAAAGIPSAYVGEVTVLDYGSDAALEFVRANADEIAAVLVEPVQSRRPELQPAEFVRALRKLTEEAGVVLILDEIVTGFRAAPGGVQEIFGVRADLATYGKVVGGGMPIGVIAGKRELMDALDGGFWQYGDASIPEVGVTYFAGTFVRHPLVLAAAKAVLDHLKREGPELQRAVNRRTDDLTAGLNAFAREVSLPLEFAHFTSMMKPHYLVEQPVGDLLFAHMRLKGIHVWDGRPCFLTTVHTDADVKAIVEAFRESFFEMQRGGFFVVDRKVRAELSSEPPVPGARLGRDRDGNPGWFVPDPEQAGKYRQVLDGVP